MQKNDDESDWTSQHPEGTKKKKKKTNGQREASIN